MKTLSKDNEYLEKKVRHELAKGDDYTAKAFARLATNAEDRKFLMKIIKNSMYENTI
jgi:hypothetical protein